MVLKIDKRCSVLMCFNTSEPLRVYSGESVFHYRKTCAIPGGISVNLFPGVYEICPEPISVKKLPFLNKIPDFKLPRPEKEFDGFEGKKFTVRKNYKINYTPARTKIGQGLIEYTSRMEGYPIPIIRFVTYHELGHNLYFTEWKCDVFALWLMMKQGWGKSQCYYAIEMVMGDSPAKSERLEKLKQYLKKVKTWR